MKMLYIALVLSCLVPCLVGKDYMGNGINPQDQSTPPNIIFIMADDLGWNDVGYHGSNQIPTPNIDALAYNGLILNNYYVSAICTPSRSALMTGKHPIHTGMQHRVLYGAEARGLPLTEKILPEYLQRLGYETHIVGKWHLGFFKKEYTPTYRGFQSHIGYWTGHHDYFDHTAFENQYWGLDMRRGMEPAWDLHGQYSTHVFTRESVNLIQRYNSTKPLFLYLAHAAVHSANPYNPLPAPDDTVAKFSNIPDFNRRKFAAMLSELDDSVGKVVDALKAKKMLSNSIIIFSTDNGGPADGFNLNHASNWPLRGVKNTLWEGGVRGAGIIWSPRITNSGRVGNQLMHVSDWLPTLYSAAGGDVRDLGPNLDGHDLWESLVNDLPSERKMVLHNIDDIYGNSAFTLEGWKLVQGTTYNGQWDGWYGPAGRDKFLKYDIGQILGSRANRAISTILPAITPDKVKKIRGEATVTCPTKPKWSPEPRFSNCKPLHRPCLFNIETDPCEMENLADKFPEVTKFLQSQVVAFNQTAVRPANLPWDSRADPRFWDHTWNNFGDYSFMSNAVRSLKMPTAA